MKTPQLGLGLYDLRECAQFTGLDSKRVRRWFVPPPSEAKVRPILTPDYPRVQDDTAISFLDLIEVFVLGNLREHGVPLQTLRKVYGRLQRDFKQKHPLAHNRLATDGREVFLRVADNEGKDQLIEVLTKQMVFPEIIAPFLKQLDYDPETHLARLWRIAAGVLLNPRIALGKPVVDGVFVKTEVLAAAYRANKKDAEVVARWYNVSPSDVLTAVRFEADLAA
ncbi:MAG: hypothetical protein L0241_09760 [Planctomycetia bacterium]|nr:hypothetical protein [Planctomycetia bacterium]